MAMNMGNDLLFYESRRQAIERVKQQQQKAQSVLKQFDSFNFEPAKNLGNEQSNANNSNNFSQTNAMNRGTPQNQGTSNNGASPQRQNNASAPFLGGQQNQQEQQRQQSPPFQQRTNGFSQSNGETAFNGNRKPSSITGILENFLKGGNQGGGKDILGGLKGQIGEVSKPIQQILDNFDIDSEKLIILMVMWVLFNEKSDKTLLLALGYLLL